MTPGQRLALTLKLTEEAEPYLLYGTPCASSSQVRIAAAAER